MSEMLEQAKSQIGDTRQDLSALTCAMIAQAEAATAQAKELGRIATALERLVDAQGVKTILKEVAERQGQVK